MACDVSPVAMFYILSIHIDFKVNSGQNMIALNLHFNIRCVICMIEFNVGDSVRYLPCMHTYHVEVTLWSLFKGLQQCQYLFGAHSTLAQNDVDPTVYRRLADAVIHLSKLYGARGRRAFGWSSHFHYFPNNHPCHDYNAQLISMHS